MTTGGHYDHGPLWVPIHGTAIVSERPGRRQDAPGSPNSRGSARREIETRCAIVYNKREMGLGESH